MRKALLNILPNGFRVAIDPMAEVGSVLAGVWALSGSVDETAGQMGISHFLEHMAFKGTKRRNYREIAETIENIGGELNAYTSRDHTFYFARTLAEHLPISVELLSDIVRNSVFDAGEIEKERAVITQEILTSLDDPMDLVNDQFAACAYPDQPYGRPIAGTRESIAALSRADMLEYVRRNYGANRLMLVVAGAAEEGEVMRLAERHFGDLAPSEGLSDITAAYKGGTSIKEKDLEQTYFMLGFPCSPYVDRRESAAEVAMAEIFGGGMSSRLFQELRERRNLVYSIGSSIQLHKNNGLFYVYASSEPKRMEEVVPAVQAEAAKIMGGVGEDELERARLGIKTSLIMARESVSSRARQLGRQIQYTGKPVDPEEDLELITSLNRDDIRRAAGRVLVEPSTKCVLGSPGQSRLKKILA